MDLQGEAQGRLIHAIYLRPLRNSEPSNAAFPTLLPAGGEGSGEPTGMGGEQ